MDCLTRIGSFVFPRHREWETRVCACSRAPLMPVEGSVEGQVLPEAAFALSCEQIAQSLRMPSPSAPAQLEMYADTQYAVVWPESYEFDFATGARYVGAEYTGTFYLMGAKYYDPVTGRVMIVVSTPASNRLSEYRHTRPFNEFAVYESHGPDHTRELGGGMDFYPKFTDCDPHPRKFGDVFQQVEVYDCMEDVFVAAGINDFHRFICGYHIHEKGVSTVDPRFCPLDWYYQTHTQYQMDPDVFDHYLILDEVCPTNFWQGDHITRLGKHVWSGHRIGVDASWL
jgi:hypothetical protein